MKTLKLNPGRPVEKMVGANLGMIEQRLGNTHCMSSILTAARAARPGALRAYNVPIQMRRGWALAVFETIRQYRETYLAVMGGNFERKEPLEIQGLTLADGYTPPRRPDHAI